MLFGSDAWKSAQANWGCATSNALAGSRCVMMNAYHVTRNKHEIGGRVSVCFKMLLNGAWEGKLVPCTPSFGQELQVVETVPLLRDFD